MNQLAAYEFTLRTEHISDKRQFLLDFCKTDFDLTSERSDVENVEDCKALQSDYKSVVNQVKRKKLLALN